MTRSPAHVELPGERQLTAELLKLAAPIIAMMISRTAMGFIDFWMVSYLGTTAQAAISPAAMLIFTVSCLGMGVANAVQTFVAQADGRGQGDLAGAYTWQSLYVALLCAVAIAPLAATTETWYGHVARLAQHDAEMARLEIQYTRIALWSVPPAVLSIGLNSFFMGIQRPRPALLAVIVSLLVNAVGNYVLIFGKLGAPALGMRGAAIATVAGWGARVLFLAGAMMLPEFDRRYRTRRIAGWSNPRLAGMLRVGGPTSLHWLIDIGSWLVFLAVIIPPLGVNAVAGSNIGLQLMHLSFMPAVGIGIALCSQVGFSIGRRCPERAVAQTRVAMRLNGAYMGAIGLVFLLCGAWLTRLFNHDPAVVAAGRLVLIGAGVFQVFDAMAITHVNALRGAGDTRWPAVAVLLTCWGIFVGGGALVTRLRPEWGVLGPWATCALYIIVLGVALRWRWRSGHWRQIKLFSENDEDNLAHQAS